MRIALCGLFLCTMSYAAADTPSSQTVMTPVVATASPGAATATATATAAVAASTAATVPAVVPAVSTTASVPPASKLPSCEEIKAFKAKMHAAVDAALKYPAELKFRPASGVTIVTYDYQDGRTENAHITQWSGDGRLDRAALNAVKDADFAAITPGIGHHHIHDAVIIVFDNSANIDKNAAEHEKKKAPAKEQCG